MIKEVVEDLKGFLAYVDFRQNNHAYRNHLFFLQVLRPIGAKKDLFY